MNDTPPVWIPISVIHSMPLELLNRFGGSAGVRDEGLLESALNRPPNLFEYESADIFQLAAAYAQGIVNNHPFVDGNKRTGFVAAYVFLGANGCDLVAPETEVVLQTLALAAGELDQAGSAAWLQRQSQPRSNAS